jgi:beta-galactosidase
MFLISIMKEKILMKKNLLLKINVIVFVASQFIFAQKIQQTETLDSKVLFNEEWLFARFGDMPDGSKKDEPEGIEKNGFNDSSWRSLDLPHDWGIEGPFRKDLPSNTGKLPWMGIGWYRKHFALSQDEKWKRVFIDFDGAMSHAKVWLNGKYVGGWPYGYASFRLDITPYLNFGKENIIAVRLENPPQSSRWYPGSGIYRNVWLVRTSPVHLTHWSSFITTPKISSKQATVHLKTEIENQSTKSSTITVLTTIQKIGTSQVIGANQSGNIQIPVGKTMKAELDIILQNPQVWNLESPALYQANIYVKQKKRIIDSTTVIFGIRTVQFTADSGFILNGQRVQIKGVCNHHDLGILGAAINEKALQRQIRLLQEMGCNAIRTSHNPPAPELLDLCDSMGMLVLDEAFDCWEQGKTQNDYSTLFKEWHEKDIRAFVRRDRNHPCVIGWSAGNEVREQGDSILIQKLKEIFISEDPTRQVTAGCDKPEAGFNGFQKSVDMFGYNYKPHLYAKFHQANPTKPLYGSETASCVSTNGEYFFPVSDDKAKGAMNNQVSSYDLSAPWWATPPDVEFRGQDSNSFVAGEFVWTGFDYLGEPTPYWDDTSISRSSYFGILDLCGFKKDRFYLYQARWRPEFPMVHILPHWNWPDRVGQVTPVHVYTSGDEAELFLNGKPLGRQKKDPFHYRLRWDSVKYESGELQVVTYKQGKKWASDSRKTTGSAVKVFLEVEQDNLKANGKDLAYINVRILDKENLIVPTANNLVRFKVTGPATIAAVGNGDPTDHHSFQSDQYRAFHGQCLLIVRSATKHGSIQIVAESDSLESGKIELISR